MPALDREERLSDPSSEEHAAARNWVDWLVSGSCTEGDFITQVLLLEDENPGVAFEVLALLDQRNRRHQLHDDLFTRVKGRLLQASLGYGEGQVRGSRDKAPATPALRIEDAGKGRLRPGGLLKGRYRIVEILGRTEASTVFEAIDEVRAELPDVPQRVAIHLISEERSRELALVQRLYRLQALSHPCIMRIFDINEDDGELFFTTEWSPAQPLRQLLASTSGPSLALQARQSVLGSVGAALGYAHACGIAHGDVHAGNILISNNGEARLHGFVQEGRHLMASCAADRLAYARLVFEVLWASEAPGKYAPSRAGRDQVLRRPPGLTNDQWRLLKGALQGGEAATDSTVLALFPAVEPGAASFAQQRAMPVQSRPRRRQSGPLAAAAAVVAILGLGFYAEKEGKLDLSLLARDASVEFASTAQAAPTLAAPPAALPVPVPVPVEPVTASAASGAAPVVAAPAAQQRTVLDLPTGVIQVAADEPVARILVRRRGSLRGPVTFQWKTEASSAQEERDFAPVATRWDVIADGSQGIELLVPLVRGSERTERRVFYVQLHRVGMGATLGERTLVQVELLPSVTAPGNTAASQ